MQHKIQQNISSMRLNISNTPLRKPINDLEENEGDGRNIILNPGRNRITLTTRAGAVGEYSIYQLSVVAFCEKLDILSQLGQSIIGSGASRSQFRVISHPVTVSVLRHHTESNTASTATPAKAACSDVGIPSFSKVAITSGSTSSIDFSLGLGAE